MGFMALEHAAQASVCHQSSDRIISSTQQAETSQPKDHCWFQDTDQASPMLSLVELWKLYAIGEALSYENDASSLHDEGVDIATAKRIEEGSCPRPRHDTCNEGDICWPMWSLLCVAFEVSMKGIINKPKKMRIVVISLTCRCDQAMTARRGRLRRC